MHVKLSGFITRNRLVGREKNMTVYANCSKPLLFYQPSSINSTGNDNEKNRIIYLLQDYIYPLIIKPPSDE